MTDSGLDVRLLPVKLAGIDPTALQQQTVRIACSAIVVKLAGIDPTALQQFGHLLETFVVGEVLKKASWMSCRPHVGQWRTHDGFEVDLVLENDRHYHPGSHLNDRR